MIRARELTMLPYSTAYHASKLYLEATRGPAKLLVWPRNSFVLGTLTPFVSDLDLTIWFEDEPTSEQIQRTLSGLGRLRRLFPMLGEANMYVSQEARAWAGLMNYLELERDPDLGRRLSRSTESLHPGQRSIEASVFILRMLESDIHNVLARPSTRRAKWDSHATAAARTTGYELRPLWVGFPERSLLRGIVEVAVQLASLDVPEMSTVVDSIERYFEMSGRGVPRHILRGLLNTETYWLAFFPHRFCFGEVESPRLEGRATELCEAQLCWETWGAASQYRQLRSPTDRVRLSEHLTAIRRFCDSILPVSSRRELLISALDSLLVKTSGAG